MELNVLNSVDGLTISRGGFEYHFAFGMYCGEVRMFIFSNIDDLDGSRPDFGMPDGYGYSFASIRNSIAGASTFMSRYGVRGDEEHFNRISEALSDLGQLWTPSFDSDAQPRAALIDDVDSPDKGKIKEMRKVFNLKNVIGGNSYTGRHSYHSKDMNELNQMKQGGTEKYPYWVGVELEVETNNDACLDYLKSIRSNWFYIERDGSLDSDYGCEIITIKMNPRVASSVDTWKELCENLSRLGAKSHDTTTCGLHVHVSKTALGSTVEQQDEAIGRLIHLYHNELGGSGSTFNYVALVMRRSYTSYASNVLQGIGDELSSMYRFTKDAGLESVSASYTKKAFKGLNDSSKQAGRYSAINRGNAHTIEFRQGRGTLKPTSIVAMVQFCCELVEFSRISTNKTCNRARFLSRIQKLSDKNELKKLLIQ